MGAVGRDAAQIWTVDLDVARLFWTNDDNSQVFWAILEEALTELAQGNVQKLVLELKTRATVRSQFPSDQAVRDGLADTRKRRSAVAGKEKPRKIKAPDKMVVVLASLQRACNALAANCNEQQKSLADRTNALWERWLAFNKGRGGAKEVIAAQSDQLGDDKSMLPEDSRKLAELIERYWKISQEELAKTNETFWNQEEREAIAAEETDILLVKYYRRYVVYRLDEYPQRALTSFMVIKPAGGTRPIVEFVNYASDPRADDSSGQSLRISSGFILPQHGYISFIGEVNGGECPKFMVMERARTPRKVYEGILVSLGSGGNPMSERFLMKRTEIMHSKDVATGSLRLSSLNKEERAELGRFKKDLKRFVLRGPSKTKTR